MQEFLWAVEVVFFFFYVCAIPPVCCRLFPTTKKSAELYFEVYAKCHTSMVGSYPGMMAFPHSGVKECCRVLVEDQRRAYGEEVCMIKNMDRRRQGNKIKAVFFCCSGAPRLLCSTERFFFVSSRLIHRSIIKCNNEWRLLCACVVFRLFFFCS